MGMGKRQVIEGEGLPHHQNPIPTAVRIGQFLFSSAIPGQDPATGELPADPEQQVVFAFENVRRVMAAGGGTTDDIAKMTVFLQDLSHRQWVNREWLKMFPDEHDRPVRHAVKSDLPGGMVVQLEILAVL
jgi:2-iminobutanoate/2-iminopropanoate deaminase